MISGPALEEVSARAAHLTQNGDRLALILLDVHIDLRIDEVVLRQESGQVVVDFRRRLPGHMNVTQERKLQGSVRAHFDDLRQVFVPEDGHLELVADSDAITLLDRTGVADPHCVEAQPQHSAWRIDPRQLSGREQNTDRGAGSTGLLLDLDRANEGRQPVVVIGEAGATLRELHDHLSLRLPLNAAGIAADTSRRGQHQLDASLLLSQSHGRLQLGLLRLSRGAQPERCQHCHLDDSLHSHPNSSRT
jgi:hypothetical protein